MARGGASKLLVASVVLWGCALPSPRTPLPRGADTFDATTDLVSLHYDHAPDRDDGHSAAADRTLLEVLYGACWLERHAVAVSGTHGWLGFTFRTDSDAVMEAAWGDRGGWLRAHRNREGAAADLAARWRRTLAAGGDVWVKEGGSSDLTAVAVARVRAELPSVDTRQRIHVVQHGDWNEWLTWLRAMRFTRRETDFRRIPNANAYLNVAGGDPGFESAATSHAIFGPVWSAAFAYYDPRRRLDFSDTGELLHILGLGEMGIHEFGERFLRSEVEQPESCEEQKQGNPDGGGRHRSPAAEGIGAAPAPVRWPQAVASPIAGAAKRSGSSALVVVHRDRSVLVERSATVRDLMMSRSGIYLRAANETPASTGTTTTGTSTRSE